MCVLGVFSWWRAAFMLLRLVVRHRDGQPHRQQRSPLAKERRRGGKEQGDAAAGAGEAGGPILMRTPWTQQQREPPLPLPFLSSARIGYRSDPHSHDQVIAPHTDCPSPSIYIYIIYMYIYVRSDLTCMWPLVQRERWRQTLRTSSGASPTCFFIGLFCFMFEFVA